jgi:CTP synthase (UTP-ammonia lyase)
MRMKFLTRFIARDISLRCIPFSPRSSAQGPPVDHCSRESAIAIVGSRRNAGAYKSQIEYLGHAALELPSYLQFYQADRERKKRDI